MPLPLLYAVVVRLGLQRILALAGGMLLCAAVLAPKDAAALPLFARQTGQNCVACHAGGQFPELTPYGRMFKMTGYTIGERTIPFSVMGVIGDARVANTNDPAGSTAGFDKNGSMILGTGSLFVGGKITDNIGAFAQITYDPYSMKNTEGQFVGHTVSDNMDFRYADRFVDANRDIIFGVSLNNNPSVSDPWNTAAAWMQYVPVLSPGAYQFVDGNAPFPGLASGGNVAGLTAYMLWNKSIYGELGFYRTANKMFSFMSQGLGDPFDPNFPTPYLSGTNPYWRLAYTHEWGPHNIMVGTSGMVAHVFDNTLGAPTSDGGAYQRIKTVGVDSQYQYLLDPHTVTAQFAYMKTTVDDSALGGGGPSIDTPQMLRAKLSYIYQAKYGGSLSYFNQTDAKDITKVISGMTYEVFWMPVQYVRVGAQYTAYSKYQGASTAYDGFRNASDNNTLMFYVWGAY